jgi:hypothetical protein
MLYVQTETVRQTDYPTNHCHHCHTCKAQPKNRSEFGVRTFETPNSDQFWPKSLFCLHRQKKKEADRSSEFGGGVSSTNRPVERSKIHS